MYARKITRKYETGDNETIKGRDAGLMVGTSNDPDADYEITYAFETGAQSKGRLKRISNGTSTSVGLPDGGVEYEYVDNGDAVHWINYKNGGGTVLASAEKVYGMSGDHRDLLTSIENRTGTTTVSKYAYANDNAGRRTSVITTGTAFGSGAFNIWGYNDRNELTSSGRYNGTDINNTQSEVAAERRGYGYDPIGNRKTHAIATGGPTVYTTNTVNQYESTAVPRETLQYDEDGNVTRMGVIPADINEDSFVDTTDFDHFSDCLNTTPAPPPCYDTDLNHDSYVNDSDMTVYNACYAQPPNPPACPSPTAPATYTWDAENRLIAVTPVSPLASSKKLTFAYDHMSRRIRKQVYTRNSGNTAWNTTPSEDWRFVYDDWNVVLVLNASGAAQKRYAWGLDLSGQNSSPLTKGGTGGWGSGIHGAGGIGGLLAVVESPGTGQTGYWFFYDGNGNVGQVIRADNQQTVARYEYDPYGNTIVEAGDYALNNPFRFSTKWFHAEIELYDFGFRYYSPRLGRWANRDPIGEWGGINTYAFISNDVVGQVDPVGFDKLHLRPLNMHSYIFVNQVDIYLVTDLNAQKPVDAIAGARSPIKVLPYGAWCGKLWKLDPDATAAKGIQANGRLPARSQWDTHVFRIGDYLVEWRVGTVFWSYDILPIGTAWNRGDGHLWGLASVVGGLVAVPSVITREEWGGLPDWKIISRRTTTPVQDWHLYVSLEEQKKDPPWFGVLWNNCYSWVMSWGDW